MSFAELGLSDKVVRAVADAGYTEPTPIQAQAIPHVLARRDVLGIAQTGTGKTAAFTLPMLTLLETGRARARMPRTLVLEPTRELAAQVVENFDKYGVNHNLSVALIIGGVSFADQDAKLTRGVDVLIATPGRLLDHFERGKLLLTGVELLVIDEADRMLDMGFIPDIERIVKLVPFTRQTLFFSATMPPEITRLADNFLHNPVRAEVSRPASAASTITQRLYRAESDPAGKRRLLRDLIRSSSDFKNAIIFCNRKREVATLHKSLQQHGFSAAALHGDLDQRARMIALDSFRSGAVPLLVASDVAARGLDIPAVSHVLNYDVPHHAEDYVHRIGRTGRAGRNGFAFTLVAPGDEKSVGAIESLMGQPVAWEDAPEGHAPAEGERSERAERSERGERSERARGDREPRSSGRRGARRTDSTRAGSSASPEKTERTERAERAPRAEGETRPGRAPRRARAEEPREAAPTEPARPSRRSRPDEAPSPRASEDRRPGRGDTRRSGPREASGRSEPRNDDRSPIGLGEHVPAFLRRSVAKTAD